MLTDDDNFDPDRRTGPPLSKARITEMIVDDRADMAARPRRLVAERWLHVHDDGREDWFTSPPADLPTLRVRLLDYAHGVRIEETKTHLLNCQPIRPRGDGWSKFAVIEAGSAVWRRPHKGNVSWGE